MKKCNKNSRHIMLVALCLSLAFTQCTKFEKDDNFEKGAPPPIGDYTNSSEIATADLVAYFPFEDSYADVKGGITGGSLKGIGGGFTAGKKGRAYKSGDSSFIAYDNAGPLANLTSLTVSFWINTVAHASNAHSVFMVTQTSNWIGNLFFLIEGVGTSTTDNVVIKSHVAKWSVPFAEQWTTPTVSGIFGGWRHIVVTYNETTSEISFYISGSKVDLKGAGILKSGVGNELYGALGFKDAARFVIGGYQANLGAPYNSPDSWMDPYTGSIDEMRFYKRALTAAEVNSLFQLEKQGR